MAVLFGGVIFLLELSITTQLEGSLHQNMDGEWKMSKNRYVNPLGQLISDVLNLLTSPSKIEIAGDAVLRPGENLHCMALIADSTYSDIFATEAFAREPSRMMEPVTEYIPSYNYRIEEKEDSIGTESLFAIKREGCRIHILLMEDGERVARFLNFVERSRVLDARSKFIILHDAILFEPDFLHLWRKIVNVIFLRLHHGRSYKWFEILTVPFPSAGKGAETIGVWSHGDFHQLKNVGGLFEDKTWILFGHTLRVFMLEHMPSAIRIRKKSGLQPAGVSPLEFSGVEIEILKTLSNLMDFHIDMEEIEDDERWGRELDDGNWTGLFGALIQGDADIAIGNLYYIPFHLDKFDLSIPYTVQCLTFLTPESRTDNSWVTLILPFRAETWGAIIFNLIATSFLFRSIAVVQRCLKHGKTKKQKREKEIQSINPFSTICSAMLYSWGMLLQVPIPSLPISWPLRLFSGSCWIFCLLTAVSYRSSMTAVLSSPPAPLLFDTLKDLASSSLTSGGWGRQPKVFFETAPDKLSRLMAQHFETLYGKQTSPEMVAQRVAQGHFAYYENDYWLRDAKARYPSSTMGTNTTTPGRYGLHIMNECAIKLPVSLGLSMNSPLKARVDMLLSRLVEGGLTWKWLADAMQPTLAAERRQHRGEWKKALVDLKKMYGALLALCLGYLIASGALIAEVVHHRKQTVRSELRNPNHKKEKSVRIRALQW